MSELILADCRDGLRQLIERKAKVQMVVTSPPYWALRDYLGNDQWVGGDSECDHMKPGTLNKDFNARWGQKGGKKKQETSGRRPWPGDTCGSCGAQRVSLWEGGDPKCSHRSTNARPDHSLGAFLGTRGEQGSASASATPMRRTCKKCGAVRVDKQIGLEETPEQYVENLVSIFRMVREVLADDGVVWLNLGDSFASGGCGARDPERWPTQSRNDHLPKHAKKNSGIRAKNKLFIPHRVAIALQADGWIARQDCVWEKKSAMPESVVDRPTTSHEYVFLLAKSERYFYDHMAVREPQTGGTNSRGPKAKSGDVAPKRFVAAITKEDAPADGMRNRRSVWTLSSQPYSGAHFATYPPELAKICILAGSRPGDVVLDPFMGSGTTAYMAQMLGRKWIGIELNPAFAPLIRERTTGENGQMGLLL